MKRHIASEHPDQNIIVPKSPKKPCKWCGVSFTDLKKHIKKCSKKQQEEASDAQESVGENFASMSNEDFIVFFRQYLNRPGGGIVEATAKLYMGQIKKIIEFEIRKNPQFSVTSWFNPNLGKCSSGYDRFPFTLCN